MNQSTVLNVITAELKLANLDLSNEKFKASMGIRSDPITTYKKCRLYNFFPTGFAVDYGLLTIILTWEEYELIKSGNG